MSDGIFGSGYVNPAGPMPSASDRAEERTRAVCASSAVVAALLAGVGIFMLWRSQKHAAERDELRRRIRRIDEERAACDRKVMRLERELDKSSTEPPGLPGDQGGTWPASYDERPPTEMAPAPTMSMWPEDYDEPESEYDDPDVAERVAGLWESARAGSIGVPSAPRVSGAYVPNRRRRGRR